MKKLIFTVILLCQVITIPLASAFEKEIGKLGSNLAEAIAQTSHKTIAVADFTDLQNNVTELGRFLAEEISVSLAGSGKGFEVVDRGHLRSLLQEHQLALSGLIDPSTAQELGKISGVQILVTGTTVPFGDSVRLSLKVLDTASAKIISATAGNFAKTSAVEELLARGVVTRAVGVSGRSSTKKKANTDYVSVFGKFKFTLNRCKRDAESVVCFFSITHSGSKATSVNLKSSYVYDEEGQQHLYSSWAFGGDNASRGSVSAYLIPNIAERGLIEFEQIDEKIEVITLGVIAYASGPAKFIIHDIQLEK